ncbi:MAG: UDP-N-acetylglucosamine 1-carboxyvinyltransferase [Clostridia bacterium]|nr:UDP-N-acetylglucosamine 1-carboxyvinyltransferase [Clostridia bacterium]
MSKYIVRKAERLCGAVKISGSKNSALPIIAASMLAEGETVLYNVPRLTDIENMCGIIRCLGGSCQWSNDELHISFRKPKTYIAPYELVTKFRASFLLIAPMLIRVGKVQIPLPGGCPIGARPIDLHLKGFTALGAKITQGHGFIEAKARKLCGTRIYLDFPSVGATENIMIASVMAEGETVIENAATEPEISDLADFLVKMGGKIQGAGTDRIVIEGVSRLKAVSHKIIPDRIEAGTYLTAGVMCRSDITVEDVIPEHIKPVMAKFSEMGIEVFENENSVRIISPSKFRHTDIKTLPFPGFPTDMQSQFTALMSVAEGTSLIVETVFENRFLHIPELSRMGAKIKVDGRTAIVDGTKTLTGAKVKASDLRGGASLVLAGLVAEGETEIDCIEHIERGYENFGEKLRSLGADIIKIQ